MYALPWLSIRDSVLTDSSGRKSLANGRPPPHRRHAHRQLPEHAGHRFPAGDTGQQRCNGQRRGRRERHAHHTRQLHRQLQQCDVRVHVDRSCQ